MFQREQRPPRPPGRPAQPTEEVRASGGSQFTTPSTKFPTSLGSQEKTNKKPDNKSPLTEAPTVPSFSPTPASPLPELASPQTNPSLLSQSTLEQLPARDQKLPKRKPQFQSVSNQIQTQQLRTEKPQITTENSPQQPNRPKPFQAFQRRPPVVLRGKLVSQTSQSQSQPIPRTLGSAPSEKPSPTTTVVPQPQGGVKTDLVSQQFTAFRKPPRPSGKPSRTLGPQSPDSDIENNPHSQNNEPEVIKEVVSSDTESEQINTFFSRKITPATRKPKTFSTLTVKPFNKVANGVRTTKTQQIAVERKKPTPKPIQFEKSKRVIFKDSTIAVSPGSVLIPETFTTGDLDDAEPTVSIPFVIEGTGRPSKTTKEEDVNVSLMIEEKTKSGQKDRVKVMTEHEFNSLFGPVSTTTPRPKLAPIIQVIITLHIY